MKKSLIVSATAVAVALFLAGCSKDSGGDGKGTISCDGINHAIGEVVQAYFGAEYSAPDVTQVGLEITTNDDWILRAGLFIPTGSGQRLVAGTYTYAASTITAFGMYGVGFENLSGDEDYYDTTSATIVISDVSGDNYTITINAVSSGKSITGNYTGKVRWRNGTMQL